MDQQIEPVLGKKVRRDRVSQQLFREQVLVVARQLFAQDGADGLSMRRIAAAVGAAPMTLYRYFPSRVHLLRHIWDDLLAGALQESNQRVAQATQPCERPGAFAEGFMAYWARQPDNYLLVFTTGHPAQAAAAGLPPYVDQSALRSHFEAIGTVLDTCVAPLAWAVDERRRVVETIFCLCVGYLHTTLYFANYRWRDVDLLRSEVVGLIHAQVRSAVTALRAQHGLPGLPD
jgi:AcrR family transcriptional regulator